MKDTLYQEDYQKDAIEVDFYQCILEGRADRNEQDLRTATLFYFCGNLAHLFENGPRRSGIPVAIYLHSTLNLSYSTGAHEFVNYGNSQCQWEQV